MGQIHINRVTAFGLQLITAAVLGSVLLEASRDTAIAGIQPTTFTKDIAPIIFDRCVECHRPGGSAPFSLVTYSAVRQRATVIATVTRSRYMPPWTATPGDGEFVGQRRLTDSEIDVIQRWIDEGALEGDSQDLPPLRRWTDGWVLGTPDLVLRPTHAYTLPAEGTDRFRVFVIPIPISTARYVRGVEFRPDNPRVTHHANILLDRTPTSRARNEQDPSLGEKGLLARSAEYPPGHLLGWTPGQPDPLLPPDLSWRLAPGTDLVVQLHMVPSGTSEVVQFSVGFYFGDHPPKRTPALLRLGRQHIDIPAGERNYTIADSYVLPVGVAVLALKPHAHYRAREMKGYATLPNGTTKSLFHIKEWDFRWQHVNRYVVPPVLPRGTTLTMEYGYDNSAENARNPQQPPQRVRWGPRAFEEMGDLWIQVLTTDQDLDSLNHDFRRKWIAEDIVGYHAQIATDPENFSLHDDAAALYLELGRRNDAIVHLEASVRLQPDSAVAHFNLGAAFVLVDKFEEAVNHYREALRIKRDYPAAHYNLGNVLDKLGKADEALAHYRDALLLDPALARAHNNTGFIFIRRGMVDEALPHLREALRIDPELPDAHYNIGVVLQRRGELAAAVRHFRTALEFEPDSAPALANLAWVLATASDGQLRDAKQAIALAERAAHLTRRRNAETLDVLAAAYAAAGRFDQALGAIQEAIRLDPPPAITAGLLKRQDLYRKGQPYHEPGGRK